MMKPLKEVVVGDTVYRNMAAGIVMPLIVTAVTDSVIECGPWTFCRVTGGEIDEELEWGPTHGVTGSIIHTENQKERQ